ncbi:hypothetical protein [Aquamicrobium sp.]|uniref:hypothetical protein n=1 Tax=Aquamicrobium sp. TaxID=1872579 RepID=UPI00258E55A7|nr:hypothetical protein [Aquamicrobium sp.]MCK9549470.1 hypothetical protein [Aquamicrobium sp.]
MMKKNISPEKKQLLSQILGNTVKSVSNHIEEGRKYIDFFDLFSEKELLEFLETGKIKKLDIHKNNSEDVLRLARFKVYYGLKVNRELVYPLFLKTLNCVVEDGHDIKNVFIRELNNQKGLLIHPNYIKIITDFITNFLSEEELLSIVKYKMDIN